ncbi:MAG: hypothetical protein ACLTXT_00265 [Ruminococcus callidus]
MEIPAVFAVGTVLCGGATQTNDGVGSFYMITKQRDIDDCRQT